MFEILGHLPYIKIQCIPSNTFEPYQVTDWLALLTTEREVPGLNAAKDCMVLHCTETFIVILYCLDMT